MIFNEKGHLTVEGISALCAGALSSEERLRAAEHIAGCPACASRLAASLEVSLSTVPEGFAEQVVNKAENVKAAKDKRQFLFYSLRVSLAACIALVILFSGLLNRLFAFNVTEMKLPDLHAVSQITERLSSFSEKVMNMEVFTDEKEKK